MKVFYFFILFYSSFAVANPDVVSSTYVSDNNTKSSSSTVLLEFIVHPQRIVINEEGQAWFDVSFYDNGKTGEDYDPCPEILRGESVTFSISNTNEDLVISPREIVVDKSNCNGVRVNLFARRDSDSFNDRDTVRISAPSFVNQSVSVVISEVQAVKAHVLAIPNTRVKDNSSVRVRCKQDEDCKVYFECSEQETGEKFTGLEDIRGWNTKVFTAQDIENLTGNKSWDKRLGCALRSHHEISAQIWTRSGDGVLVNNSQFISSVKEGRKYRADVESITSPTSTEKSNIRIRCKGDILKEEDCTKTELACYTDRGKRYDGDLGTIPYLTVRHLQAQELSELINYKAWEGQGLTCEVRSDEPFTVQVLTRTGGGGALVNNSAN